ncbi:hypothetical protein [Sphingobacterium faecale]|uniref:DUF4959 domain-containing protein n=1 Tax=Sphingobacterium faecale TaxID=2803775 RepID=A0ABS1QXK1_9SPHI|nr:hypothetical protein [Sphingobacterium faecale]MBL1407149.1 hypothetical protein [Sphingobacterium faecale]
MKQSFKNIVYLIGVVSLFAQSCKPDEFATFENPIQDEEIKIIELVSDHKTVLADGTAEMEFRYLAYGIKEVLKLKKETIGKEIVYSEESVLDTFLIPKDRISPDFVKVYFADGRLLANNRYKPEAGEAVTQQFYAKGGAITSDKLTITIRKDEVSAGWEELEIPLMFHLMIPPATVRPTYEASSTILQEKVDYLNRVYNKIASKDPNGGHAKIKFVLAKYDPKGNLLQERGLRRVNVAENMNLAGYKTAIAKELWNPAQYLNIYLCKFADNWSQTGSSSYIAPMPTMILKGQKAIPGIPAREVPAWDEKEIKDVTDVSIIFSVSEFFNPSQWDSNNANNSFDLSTVIGYHLGLFQMEAKLKYNSSTGKSEYELFDGDTDYCPDTDVYTGMEFGIYKREYFEERMFTTFNVMAGSSRKNSITLDQAARIREVLEKCPSRWYYKSKWAVTGKK